LRRIHQLLLAVFVGLVGSVALVEPASAAAVHSYLGNRGHAWSNTHATRVAIEDQRSDGYEIYAYIKVCKPGHCDDVKVFDSNDSVSGSTLFTTVLSPYRVQYFVVCGVARGKPALDPWDPDAFCGGYAIP
jgi:hypothetical protein